MKRLLAGLFVLSLAATNSHAGLGLRIDFGEIRGYAASGTPAGMPVGGLMLIIANDGESTFQPAAANEYVTGDNFIVGAFAMADNAGSGFPNEVTGNLGPYSYSGSGGSLAQGDELALRWFPDLTLTEYNNGQLPAAGDHYGTYSAGSTTPADGGNAWVVPSDTGTTLDLDFYTSDSGGGGNEAPSAGFASSTIAAVPEPTSFAFMLGSIAVGAVFLRRRK